MCVCVRERERWQRVQREWLGKRAMKRWRAERWREEERDTQER